MNKIKLMADSCCDISKEEAKKYEIEILPILMAWGNETIRDWHDISPKEFYHKLNNIEDLPTTSQVSPDVFVEAFQRAYEEGYDYVICTSMNGNGSGTFQSSKIAKELFFETKREREITIEVLDSGVYSYLIGGVLVEGAKRSEQGQSGEEIVAFMKERFPKMRAYAVVHTLDFLKRTGRINHFTEMVGKLLDIKPILIIGDGRLDSTERARGKRKSLLKLVELVKKDMSSETEALYVIAGDMEEERALLVELLEKEFPGMPLIYRDIGSVIAVNSGPNILAVGFVRKDMA